MPQSPYIPAKDADFDSWLLNFSALLTATPLAFGLTAPDAVEVAAVTTTWTTAYAAATNPATRTSPTVAAKDAARVAAEATVRPFATAISRNDAVTNANKVAIGVNLPNNAPVPIPPPTTAPALELKQGQPLAHVLAYKDTDLGNTKAKPYGSIGVQLWRNVGAVPATDPAQCTYQGTWTKSPNRSEFEPSQQGKIATYFARFVTRSGAGGVAYTGPWSAPLVLTVM